MKKRTFLGVMFAIAAGCVAPTWAAEENWPSKTIKIVTPMPAGGTGDVIAREFGQRLSARLRQAVIVENKPGANGTIATVAVARAPADGYTLLMTLTQHIQAPVQYKNVGYDPIADFTPLVRIGAAATVLVARPDLGVNSAADVVRMAPGKKWSMGTTALGPQVIMEVFNKGGNLGVLNVPYKGEAPAMTDLLGGQIDLALITASTARAYIQNGRLKAVAVLAPGRAPSLPNVPTFLEQGIKDVNWTGGWYGFLAPAKLPPHISARLIAEFKAIFEEPEIRAKLANMDITLNWADGAQFQTGMKQDMELWSSLVKRSGVVIEP